MTLSFPNPNRSLDPGSSRILFWGYDNIMEISFYLETEALEKFNTEKIKTESGLLKIFDTIRNQVYEIADKVYTRVGKGSRACVISPTDF
jgi:hypothetical protein